MWFDVCEVSSCTANFTHASSLAYCGKLVKILIILEPYGIFGSDLAYLGI